MFQVVTIRDTAAIDLLITLHIDTVMGPTVTRSANSTDMAARTPAIQDTTTNALVHRVATVTGVESPNAPVIRISSAPPRQTSPIWRGFFHALLTGD